MSAGDFKWTVVENLKPRVMISLEDLHLFLGNGIGDPGSFESSQELRWAWVPGRSRLFLVYLPLVYDIAEAQPPVWGTQQAFFARWT